MLKIAHTADIHIRALSRHDEYRQSFLNFINDCKSQHVDHIFVGGDIFHTKTTGISPEYIDLLTWWLTEMSTVATVHLTLGNHDGNLVNLSRQDAVSPIVEAMNLSNVHLYKKSGVYEIEPGYNLCVFSIFDEGGWSEVKPRKGCVNIAAYHGPVRGSKTEVDWEIEEGLTVDFFEDFNFAMLGDIHKTQHLGYRNGKPWITYPGSLIQQNYAEELEHGYMLWQIEDPSNWDVTFRPITGSQPFVTLDWKGSIKKLLDTASSFPKMSRFRIKSDVQLTQDISHALTETLKTGNGCAEVTYKFDNQYVKEAAEAVKAVTSQLNIRSSDVVTKMVSEFHQGEIEEKSVEKHIKKYLTEVSFLDESSRGSKWSLRELKWDNMFVYGEGNQINFDMLPGIVGIFGPNRTGKSSVVGTVMYSLFNSTDRGSIKNLHVCNVRKPHCYSRAVVDHDGSTYVVERQTTKSMNKKGITSAATSLNLFKMVNDEVIDLCGEQRTDTEKLIKKLIGTPEDFTMTALSAQGETNLFISQGSAKRRSLLSRFLDLDIFDKMHDYANKDVAAYKAQLKNYPDRDWSSLHLESEQNIKQLEANLADLATKIAESSEKLQTLKTEYSAQSSSVVVTISEVEIQKSKKANLKSKISSTKDEISDLTEEIQSLKDKQAALKNLLVKIDIEELKKKLAAQNDLDKKITELKHLFDRENTLFNQQKKTLKILEEVPCGDEYPTCKFIKDAHSNKKKLSLQEELVKKSSDELQKLQDLFDQTIDATINDKISKHAKSVELLAKIELEIVKKENDLEKIAEKLDLCQKDFEIVNLKLDAMEIALKSNQNAEAVTIKKNIEIISDQLQCWDKDKLTLANQLGRAQISMENFADEKKKRDEILSEMKQHELIAAAFSKKGIPLTITKTQLPAINSEISKILHGIVDFSIELENDEETDALEIYINYGDSKRIIELCSGMEKTIASIAIRVALINISSLPRPNFFIIDEGFGTLDNAGVESCNRLLSSLKSYFRTIIVITHVDGIKDVADHILEITRNENDSQLVC